MKRVMILLTISILSLILASSVIADDAATIKTMGEEAIAAYSAGDVEATAPYWLPDATAFFGGGVPLGEGFNQEEMKAQLEAGLKYDFQLRDVEVKVYGKTAVSTGYLEGTVTLPNGNVAPGPWRISFTWLQKDGQWKTAHLHVSELLPEVHAAQRAVSRAHQAYTDGDIEEALSCYGVTYMTVGGQDETSAGDPTRWNAGWFIPNKDAMRKTLLPFFSADNFSYTCSVEFLHTHISDDGATAVVVTKESGSWTAGEQSNSWEDITNLWSLAKQGVGWRIVGSVHQLGDTESGF